MGRRLWSTIKHKFWPRKDKVARAEKSPEENNNNNNNCDDDDDASSLSFEQGHDAITSRRNVRDDDSFSEDVVESDNEDDIDMRQADDEAEENQMEDANSNVDEEETKPKRLVEVPTTQDQDRKERESEEEFCDVEYGSKTEENHSSITFDEWLRQTNSSEVFRTPEPQQKTKKRTKSRRKKKINKRKALILEPCAFIVIPKHVNVSR